MEGVRLAGTLGSYREAVMDDIIKEDDGREVTVRSKNRVFISFVSFIPICLALHFPLTGDRSMLLDPLNTIPAQTRLIRVDL